VHVAALGRRESYMPKMRAMNSPSIAAITAMPWPGGRPSAATASRKPATTARIGSSSAGSWWKAARNTAAGAVAALVGSASETSSPQASIARAARPGPGGRRCMPLAKSSATKSASRVSMAASSASLEAKW
jgi:hypothetical protein